MPDVVVEAGLGPEFGYYHKPDMGTWLGAETMERDEAESRGYTPCHSCFAEERGPDV